MDVFDRKILIVDDEIELRESLNTYLKKKGFKNILVAENKIEAVDILLKNNIELAILDIMLPDGNGFELLENIRKKSNIPVIFLTALDGEEEKYRGFMAGGDDYIVKPFIPSDLYLKIIAILRRVYGMENKDIAVLKDVKIDFERAIIIKEDKEIELTAKEYKILQLLYSNIGKIVTIDGILENVWGKEYFGYEKTLVTHIYRIREKLEIEPSNPRNLITVKGLGYKLMPRES